MNRSIATFVSFFREYWSPEGSLLFMARETADIEISCPPSCSNSSIISERDMDGEWSFKTSISSRSSSFSFSNVKPPLGFGVVIISSQYLNHTDFTVFTETRNSLANCVTLRGI